MVPNSDRSGQQRLIYAQVQHGYNGLIHLITCRSTDIFVYSGKEMPGSGQSAEAALRSGTALTGSEPPAPLGDAEHQYVCDMWHEVTAGEMPYISHS